MPSTNLSPALDLGPLPNNDEQHEIPVHAFLPSGCHPQHSLSLVALILTKRQKQYSSVSKKVYIWMQTPVVVAM
jgi:hypothetical protein